MSLAGQAQKEFSVNAAHLLADTLLHPCVEGERADPPAAPAAGECWLVAAGAVDAFSGHVGAIAAYGPGGWAFAAPREGMRVLDAATGQRVLYRAGAWRRQAAPALPAGGTTVDAEARGTIATLIDSLKQVGIFPAH